MVNSTYSNKALSSNRKAYLHYKDILICLALVVALIFFSGCTRRVTDGEQVDPSRTIVIKFSHVTTADSPKGMAVERFAELARQRTGGRVEVQVFHDSSLYKDGEEFEALLEGKVQLIAPAASKLAEIAPVWQVLDLPYLFPSYEAVHRFIDGPARDRLFEPLRAEGLVPLAFWDNGFKQMTNRVRPLVHPADFAGLRFRVMMNSAVLREQFRLLNAEPIPLAFSDVPGALAQDRVDGQENTLSNLRTKNLCKEQRYMTLSNHGFLGYVVLAEQGFWASLPPDVRAVLEDCLEEVTAWERNYAAGVNEKDLEILKSAEGLEIHIQTAEERREWEQALAPVYAFFAEKVSAELIDAAREAGRQGGESAAAAITLVQRTPKI